MLQLHLMILNDGSTFCNSFQRLYDREIRENRGTNFFNCKSTCDLIDVPALIYVRKLDARPFDTIQDIL